MKPKTKIIFIPGNGGGDTRTGFWPYLKGKFEEKDIQVISPGIYPDPIIASQEVWVPFIESFVLDEHTILIGHSTGAIAAMRIAEKHTLLGLVLISAYHSDLGLEMERQAHYFDTPWEFDAIKNNAEWIIQFASIEDELVPIEEARFVHEQIESEYYELSGYGHFYPLDQLPEVGHAVLKKLE